MANVVVTNILAWGAKLSSISRTKAKATPPRSPPYIIINCSVQLSFFILYLLATRDNNNTPITRNTMQARMVITTNHQFHLEKSALNPLRSVCRPTGVWSLPPCQSPSQWTLQQTGRSSAQPCWPTCGQTFGWSHWTTCWCSAPRSSS